MKFLLRNYVIIPEASAVALERRRITEKIFRAFFRQMRSFLRDWSFFLVLLRDEMRRSWRFISLDPSYLDCSRACEIKL